MWPFSSYPEVSASQVDGKSYDYVIVGGGTAGCMMASRLSEDANVSVLVIEKGHVKDSLVSRIPLLSQTLFMGEPLQIQRTRWTEPMVGANGRKNRLWTAEGIGGASRVNAMLWTRGTPGDYGVWEEMGLDDWAYDKVEPYFRRLENATSHPESKARGHDGPFQMRQSEHPFQWTSYVKKAAEKVGLPIAKDYNDPKAPAIGFFQLDACVNQRGERVSAMRALLNKDIASSRRGRLTVCTGTIASRLELDGEAGLATGVHIRSAKPTVGDSSPKDFFVKANREVIVCSGALCSPQLLLLSGLGPKDSGKDLGIPLVKELPAVGATLSDHYSFAILVELPKKETIHVLESIWGLWHMILWCLFGVGLMGMSTMLTSIFIRSGAIDEETMEVKLRDENNEDNLDISKTRNVPDLEIMLFPVSGLEKAVPGRSLFSIYPTIVQPHGSGRIELASTDPLAHPRVTHPLLLDDRDFITARKAVRFSMRLAEEFRKSGYPYPAEFAFAPGNKLATLREWEKTDEFDAEKTNKDEKVAVSVSGVQKAPEVDAHVTADESEEAGKTWKTVTNEEIDDYVRRVSHTSLHYSCTCPMSNNDETKGVVDQQLRVYGFKNLRIADASVFPKVPSAHTMAPALMVADRCADFVKSTWEKKVAE